MNECDLFEYGENDFIHQTAPWSDKQAPQQSKFDVEVQQRWDRAMANGAFRYDITNIKTRILPGPSGYVAQLNTLRAIQRRAPQKIVSVQQPFNPKEFNFNKVKPIEIIFNLSKTHHKSINIPHSSESNGSICNNIVTETINGTCSRLSDNSTPIISSCQKENGVNVMNRNSCNSRINDEVNNGVDKLEGSVVNGVVHNIDKHSVINGNGIIDNSHNSTHHNIHDTITSADTTGIDVMVSCHNGNVNSTNEMNGKGTNTNGHVMSTGPSHLLVINVSPMEYGHCLLVPDCEACLPQVMTKESLEVGIETMLLSQHRGLRLGFNSLCAFASVNHLHFHMMYLEYELISDYCQVKHLSGMYHEYTALPCPGFGLQLHGTSVHELARQAHRISNYLYENDIAHNMFMCRGVVFGEERDSTLTTVRLFIWPRRKFIGSKSSEEFNVACIELVGHLPIKLEDGYHNLTEPDVNAILADACLPADEYEAIKAKVIEMGKEYESL